MLEDEGEMGTNLFPLAFTCPDCLMRCFWSDLVRDNHNLTLVDESKPVHEEQKIADGMIPVSMIRSS